MADAARVYADALFEAARDKGKLDAIHEQLAAGGAEVVQEPIDQPYGVRDCAFRDPAGNLIRINQQR